MRTTYRFALLVPMLAACGTGPLDPGRFALDGAWLGRAYPLELSLQLEQDADNRVTGTGQLRRLEERLETAVSPSDPQALDTISIDTVVTGTVGFGVRGKWDHPSFQLRLTSEGFAGATYDATFIRADSIRGTLQGSGFTSPEIVIVRQSGGG
ncbi:MAG: hypothetical protein KY467_17585 [Gemmatimonadetes bacterium]|nr:hypothetical protein [Gemmatimonadota bacterium]